MSTATVDNHHSSALDAAESSVSHLITVTLRIRRFNPEVSDQVEWEDYQLELDPKERVLDALHKIKWEIDGTLTFRRSCAHGVCGSDAMRINGRNRLACKTLLKDINPDKPITVEPIKGLTVLKDLVVDMEPFFQAYRDVMPFLVTKGNEPTRERLQSSQERERFDDTTKCILCAACTSSCPVFWNDGQYFGPAAIVNAHRFIFDSRDEAGGAAAGDPQRPRRRVALPHHVQLHGRLPARHRGHQGDPGGQAGPADPPLLSPGSTPGKPRPPWWAGLTRSGGPAARLGVRAGLLRLVGPQAAQPQPADGGAEQEGGDGEQQVDPEVGRGVAVVEGEAAGVGPQVLHERDPDAPAPYAEGEQEPGDTAAELHTLQYECAGDRPADRVRRVARAFAERPRRCGPYVAPLTPPGHRGPVIWSWRTRYVQRVSRIRKAAGGRPVLTLCAATMAATAVLSASPAYASAGTSVPPEHMSAVGGDRLGRQGTQVAMAAGVPALPHMTARSWIISNAETGAVLASHDAHWPLPPASTLKMLFADTLITKFPKSATHVVQPQDLAGMGEGSSLVGIVPHMSYSVQDLWRGVFLRSGNDAVHVLAAMNHGVKNTVIEMRAKAADLQANDTHVVTPDGYDEPGQVSSAYDLSLFARAGLQNADFREYCSTVSAEFPGDFKKGSKQRESYGIQNTDRLLAGDPAGGLKPYPGIAGVKNGYTTNAGNTYTGVADHNGVKLLVTVMHPTAGGDEVYKEAAALLDWGFEASGKVKPVGTLVAPKSVLRAEAARAEQARKAAKRSATAKAAVAGSGSHGMWTAAGITAGALVVLAALSLLVRRRWPSPAAVRRRPRR